MKLFLFLGVFFLLFFAKSLCKERHFSSPEKKRENKTIRRVCQRSFLGLLWGTGDRNSTRVVLERNKRKEIVNIVKWSFFFSLPTYRHLAWIKQQNEHIARDVNDAKRNGKYSLFFCFFFIIFWRAFENHKIGINQEDSFYYLIHFLDSLRGISLSFSSSLSLTQM